MEIINFGAKKVLLLSALFTFSMMNVIPSSECSTQQEVPLAFDKMTFGNDNTTQDENGGSLGTILQDLDRCIEIRAKLNHTDYLTACLETELSSIIFNVMEKNEGDMNAESENRTETFGNPFEEPILEKNLTPTRAHAESVQISEIKERLKMENSNSGAKLSGREVKKHDSFSIGMNRDATARNRSPPLKYTFLQGRRRGSTVKRDLSDVEKISKKPLDNEADQIQLKINNLKQPLNVDISESEMRTAFKETQKGELSEDTALESAPQRDISENVNDLKSSDQHLNDIPDAALDFKTEIKNLWRQNNIKTLRELLETAKVHLEMLGLDSNTGLLKHKFNQTEGKTTDTIDQIGTTSMVSDGIYNKPSSPFHSNHNVHLRRPKQYNLERKRESLMDMVKTLVRDVFRWKIVTYGLDKVREYSRSLNDFGAAQIMWNILRTGYVIGKHQINEVDNKFST